jgi:hypothetical protein
MKQIWPTYAYSPTTNVLTLTGLNIDRDQLLLVTAADRGRIMYNFADSSVTASAFTSGANTALTLVATTAGLTTTAALVIYFDDQATSSTVTGTVELGPTSLNALESITVTMGQVTVTGGLTDVQLRASAVTVGGTVTVGNSLTISSLPALAAGTAQIGSVTASISGTVPISISSVTIGNSITIGSCVTHGVTIANSSVTVNGTFFQGTQPVSLITLPALVAGTAQIGSVTASISGTVPVSGTFFQATQPASLASLPALAAGTNQIGSVTASISGTVPISISSVTVGNSVTIGSLPAISGTVTANAFGLDQGDGTSNAKIPIISFDTAIEAGSGGYVVPVQISNTLGAIGTSNALPISGTVTIGSALPAGTNRIGVVTIGGGTVTIGAGTSQIGSVTVGNSVTIGSLPAISGTVTANTFAVQGTAVTTSNFTSTTASTVLASYNATREVLTIFNEGAGNLHIAPGATCTTIAYQVRLAAGDYYEVPNHQTTITHSAVFATAGTARICELS